MAKIELEAMIKALPEPGEEPISMGGWSRRLSVNNPYSSEQQLRDQYYRYGNAGLLEGAITVETRTKNGRLRYFFSRALPQIYSPGEQVVEVTTEPVLKPLPTRVPSLIHVGDSFRGITPS